MEEGLKDVVDKLNESLSKNENSTTGRIPSTPEGMAIAYASLVIMAVLPIFFGSYRSVKHHKEQQVRLIHSLKKKKKCPRMIFSFQNNPTYFLIFHHHHQYYLMLIIDFIHFNNCT